MKNNIRLGTLLITLLSTTVNAGSSVSFYCAALFVCQYEVEYASYEMDYALYKWVSGDFTAGRTKTFEISKYSYFTSVTVTGLWVLDWEKVYHINSDGNFKGKMWGTIFDPNACLALDGKDCNE